MDDDGIRQRLRDAYNAEEPASNALPNALESRHRPAPSPFRAFGLLAATLIALLLLALPVAGWHYRHGFVGGRGEGTSTAGIPRSPLSSASIATASPSPGASPASAAVAAPIQALGACVRGPAWPGVTDDRVHVFSSFDFPDGAHRVTYSWNQAPVIDSTYTAAMGDAKLIGPGADGHSVTWILTGVGWTDLGFHFNASHLSGDVLALDASQSGSQSWPLLRGMSIDTSGANAVTCVGLVTIDGPTSAHPGEVVEIDVKWKAEEARFLGSGYVSTRIVSGQASISNSAGPELPWYVFSTPTGELIMSIRIPDDPSSTNLGLGAYFGGTQVCCGSNSLSIAILR